MAISNINNPNYAFFKPGDTIYEGGLKLPVFGWITTSGTDAIICFCPGKPLVGVTGFTLNWIQMGVRAVNKNYVGGSVSYDPLSDSTVTLRERVIANDGGTLRMCFRKSSSWGFTNNTTLFGAIRGSITFT